LGNGVGQARDRERPDKPFRNKHILDRQ
jgi:hypothetical protein